MLSCQNINILLTDRFQHISPIAGSGQKINSLVRSRLYRIKKSRKQVKRKIALLNKLLEESLFTYSVKITLWRYFSLVTLTLPL